MSTAKPDRTTGQTLRLRLLQRLAQHELLPCWDAVWCCWRCRTCGWRIVTVFGEKLHGIWPRPVHSHQEGQR